MRCQKSVIWADWFYGRFDAIVIAGADDSKKVDKFIHNVIIKDPDVTHTETLISLHEDAIQESYARERLKSLGVVE
jgi:DNA-binding Lrp family transcriptional regulator